MSKRLELHQICLVVHDVEKSIEHYQNILGIGPWTVHESGDATLGDMTYYGRPANQKARIAFAMAGPMQIELIQPLEGESIWGDFLKEHGEGLHHLGHVMVDNMDEALAALEKQGFPCLQSARVVRGPFTGTEFAYIDTVKTLGTIIELLKKP